MSTIADMAKKRTDRHRSRIFPVRMTETLREQLQLLADAMDSDISHEIRTAIRERLEAKGFWPPRLPKAK